jgi:intracellular septation protein
MLNEFIWRTYSTDFWVASKLWITFPLTVLFAIAQTPFLMRHQIKTDDEPRSAA